MFAGGVPTEILIEVSSYYAYIQWCFEFAQLYKNIIYLSEAEKLLNIISEKECLCYKDSFGVLYPTGPIVWLIFHLLFL